MQPHIRWASDSALLVTFGEEPWPDARERVRAATAALEDAGIPGLRNLHPAYASVLAVRDPALVDPAEFEDAVRRAVAGAASHPRAQARLVEIPVCYEGEHAPDLEEVARLHGMTPSEVARAHASADYVVAFLGFVPGFPYLDGLPASLATPRLAAPRKRVPPGSVAIGGAQTGVYPFATPGGWRIVGRTPLAIFRADRDPPTLLQAGDRVRFVAIPAAEFGEGARARGGLGQ